MRSEILADIESPAPDLLFVQPNEPFLGAIEERVALDSAFAAGRNISGPMQPEHFVSWLIKGIR